MKKDNIRGNVSFTSHSAGGLRQPKTNAQTTDFRFTTTLVPDATTQEQQPQETVAEASVHTAPPVTSQQPVPSAPVVQQQQSEEDDTPPWEVNDNQPQQQQSVQPVYTENEIVYDQDDDDIVGEVNYDDSDYLIEDTSGESIELVEAKREVESSEKIVSGIKHGVFLGNIDDYKNDIKYESDRQKNDVSDAEREDAEDTLQFLSELSDGTDAAQDHRLNKLILKHVDPKSLVNRYGNYGTGTVRARKPRYDADGNIVEHLSGEDAVRTMAYLSGGGRRVDLPNSGFHITLRNLTLRELNNHYNYVMKEQEEYGKRYGHFYFTYYDLMIKKDIIEHLLPAVITSSNYEGWRSKRKLLNAISLQDYDVILWAMGVMLYPNGYEVSFRCPHCHTTETAKCDLSKLYLLNSSRINAKMQSFNRDHAGKLIDDEALEEFRNLADFKKEISVEANGNTWIFEMKQATLADHLATGEDFNNHLKTAIGTDEFSSQIDRYMVYNRIRCYLPWIKSVTCISPVTTKDEAGNDVTVDGKLVVSDSDAILGVLDNLRDSDCELEKQFITYITSTKIAIIAYHVDKCGKCDKIVSPETHGFIPFDSSRAFFILTFRYLINDRLRQAKSRLNNISRGTTVF